MANTSDAAVPDTGTIAGRLDRLPITRTHRRATVAVGLGLFFDFYEVFLTGVLSSVLVEEFKLTKAQLPPLLASTFVGMFFGALLLGRLADRFGRRGAFLLNLGLYSLFSLLGAFSGSALMLLVTRFFAGIGLVRSRRWPTPTSATCCRPASAAGSSPGPTRSPSAASRWSASSPAA